MMKLKNSIALRPICFFFTLVLLEILIPTLVISIWHLMSKGVYKKSKLRLALLGLLLGSVLLSFTFFMTLIVKILRRETFLSAKLIKQREATQQAEQKSMNKSLAFASASHDIRSSLAALDGLISLCSAEVVPNSELYMNLQHMNKSVADLVVLLNSVLDTSKLEAGKMQLAEKEFDLAELLQDAVNLYYPVGYNKGIDVILDPCDGSVMKYSLVKGDAAKFKQILNNLLHNAIKFTSHGSVTVRSWAKKRSFEKSIRAPKTSRLWNFFSRFIYKNSDIFSDLGVVPAPQLLEELIEVVVEVEDTGKGIPKDKWKSVFENYVQVKETALEHGGTGLGLGIVQSLVRLMGGDIRIVDKEPGQKGTCFRLNVLFYTCETTSTAVSEREDIKLLNDHITIESNQEPELSMRSPVPKGSHVVLFIQEHDRSRVLQKFFQSLGIRVWALDRLDHLLSTLKKIKYKSHFSFSSSGKSELGSFGDYLSNSSSHGSKDGSMSYKDGGDNILPVHRRTSSNSNSKFVLIVIDFNGANFHNDHQFGDLCSILDSFRRDASVSLCKVVWLYTPNPDIGRRRLDEKMLAHCELIVSRPFHGSRLYQVLKLLPEFGGAATIQCYRTNPIAQIGEPSGNSSPPTPRNLIPHQQREIQLGPIQDKPLLGKKVLIVDDSQTLRMIADKLLKKLGATTELCEGGQQALAEVCSALAKMKQGASKNFPYAYVFMDCEMPTMNGYETTRHIRMEERPYDVHIPIIALTGHEDMEEEAKTKQAGMDYHLTKPITVQKLLNAISSFDSNENI